MAPVKRVLFFTYSEHGQAQIHLSTAYELLSQPDVEVHIASFEELAPRTVQISQLFNQQHESSPKKEIKYHLIDYPSMKKLTTSMQSLHHHGFFGALRSFRNMTRVLLCWKPAQYIGIVQRCSEIVDVVQPDVVVADSLFAQATDMCRQKLARKDGLLREERAKYVILNPLDFSHTFADAQPGFAGWVKIPIFGSGYPYPLPWYLIPLNIILRIRLIIAFVFSPEVRGLTQARKDADLTGLIPSFEPYRKDELYILPCVPEIDYPSYVPSNVRGCGPITIPCPPVTESDPGLATWLSKPSRRTILINLGSHITSEGSDAIEIAKGLRVILTAHPDIQVLWKLKSDVTDDLNTIIGAEVQADRIRIVRWLDTDPVAILQTGSVACMVHHGGANSFYEATATGTPQVVLPVWYDTYCFARRAEWLGIGLWASRKAAPGAEAEEFGAAVETVVGGGEEGEKMKRRARELGRICEKSGGREMAAACIVDVLSEKTLEK